MVGQRQRYRMEINALAKIMEPRFIRRAYDLHPRVGRTSCEESPDKCHQEFEAECNINNIMEKWLKTGVLTHVRRGEPMYGDFSNADDYHTAMTRVREAQERFLSLPAALRARVDNDPGKLLDFVADPRNAEELRELGLVVDQAEEFDQVERPEPPPESGPGGGPPETPSAGGAPSEETGSSGGAN